MRTAAERIEALIAIAAEEEAHDWLPLWEPYTTVEQLDALIDEWEAERRGKRAA